MKKESTQIYRIDGLGRFLEFKSDMFNFGKICVNFVKYNKKTNKKEDGIEFYLDFHDFNYLFYEVMSKGIFKKLRDVKKQEENDFGELFKSESGLPWEKVKTNTKFWKEAYPALKKGDHISRSFRIIASKHKDSGKIDEDNFAISVEIRRGKMMANDFIIPDLRDKDAKRGVVKIKKEDLIKLVFAIKSHIDRYHNVFAMINRDILYKSLEANVYKKESSDVDREVKKETKKAPLKKQTKKVKESDFDDQFPNFDDYPDYY